MLKSPGGRDESLERWLQQPKPSDGPVTESCLDAETAAAWVAGGLTGAPLEQAQSHLADCARCQAIVGVLVRADVGAQTERARARDWMGWLVPLAATAAAAIALAVWVTLPRQAGGPASSELEPVPSPQVAERKAVAAPAQPETPPRADESASLSAAVAPPEGDAAADRAQSPSPSLDKAEESRERSLDAVRIEAPAASGPATAEATAAPSPARNAPSAAPADAPAAFGALAGTPNRAAARGSIEFASPGGMVRWRLGGRAVERSVDAGATWAPVSTGVTATFTAGAAPSPTICWLAGRGGIILVTSDGVSWQRVPFPESVDLVTVTASDSRTATITTADGRTFRTIDSGTVWSR